MAAKAIWKGKLAFEGSVDRGFTLPMDSSLESNGGGEGFRPVELLLVGLAGCTGMDVISILEKKRQEVTAFEVRVSGERASDHPKIYEHIEIEYVVTGKEIDPTAVERAVELSETKYCSVSAMLSKAAKIDTKITIQNG